uniref:Uncharacterized protein n=1 Tax=Anguilla anguilla TaxID=7936 RepID=A0A0E9SR99_ANGAN
MNKSRYSGLSNMASSVTDHRLFSASNHTAGQSEQKSAELDNKHKKTRMQFLIKKNTV